MIVDRTYVDNVARVATSMVLYGKIIISAFNFSFFSALTSLAVHQLPGWDGPCMLSTHGSSVSRATACHAVRVEWTYQRQHPWLDAVKSQVPHMILAGFWRAVLMAKIVCDGESWQLNSFFPRAQISPAPKPSLPNRPKQPDTLGFEDSNVSDLSITAYVCRWYIARRNPQRLLACAAV